MKMFLTSERFLYIISCSWVRTQKLISTS